MKRALLSLAIALLLSTTAAQAADRGPSTPEERQRAVELVRLLETKPWTDEAAEARTWLMDFLGAIPDITVKQCFPLLGPPAARQQIPQELQLQHLFSSAAYLIENPGSGAKSTAAFLAGLQGTLRAYEAWKAHEPSRSHPPLEQLLAVERNGGLEAHVRAAGRSCL